MLLVFTFAAYSRQLLSVVSFYGVFTCQVVTLHFIHSSIHSLIYKSTHTFTLLIHRVTYKQASTVLSDASNSLCTLYLATIVCAHLSYAIIVGSCACVL